MILDANMCNVKTLYTHCLIKSSNKYPMFSCLHGKCNIVTLTSVLKLGKIIP